MVTGSAPLQFRASTTEPLETTTIRRVQAVFGSILGRVRWIVQMTVDLFFTILNLGVGLACLYLALRQV